MLFDPIIYFVGVIVVDIIVIIIWLSSSIVIYPSPIILFQFSSYPQQHVMIMVIGLEGFLLLHKDFLVD